MRSPRLAALAVALVSSAAVAPLVAACSSSSPVTPPAADAGADTSPSVCPADLPKTCPSPAPSWTEVQPIFAMRCWSCHADGGPEVTTIDLGTYDHIYQERTTVLSQVYGCRMPPADQPRLPADERAALLGWFVCGAPGN